MTEVSQLRIGQKIINATLDGEYSNLLRSNLNGLGVG